MSSAAFLRPSSVRLRGPTDQRVSCGSVRRNIAKPSPDFFARRSSVRATLPSTNADTRGPATAGDGDDAPPPLASRSIRVFLAVLSLAGCGESLYLTWNKLFSSPGAICSTQGCLEVLSGPFSSILGIPLSLLGALSYAVFGFLCLWPLLPSAEATTALLESQGSDTEDSPTLTQSTAAAAVAMQRDAASRPLLLAISTAQFVFSTYLVSILKFVIKSMCPYCLFSAAISATLFVTTAFVFRAVSSWRPALSITAASTAFAAVLSSASLILSWPVHLSAQPPDGLQSPPAITAQSSKESLQIADKLRAKHSKMYGAFWCSHCYDQKQRFGQRAFAKLEYIECDKFGVNSQYKLCREKRIPGYPTWEIDGELFPGEIDISELGRLADESSDETAKQSK